MKFFKIKKKINQEKIKPFLKIRLSLDKPKFPRKMFWKNKN